jgi:hypothetical protein
VERETNEVKGINNRKIKMEIKYWKKFGDGGGERKSTQTRWAMRNSSNTFPLLLSADLQFMNVNF